LQPEFLLECLKLCKEKNIHTCLDTAGFGFGNYEEILKYTDLVILDVKAVEETEYKKITGQKMNKFTPNKWVLIGIMVAMLVVLLPIMIMMFSGNSSSNVPTEPTTLQGPTTLVPSTPTIRPTIRPTTRPTTRPAPTYTTVPGGNQGGSDYQDPCAQGKHTYEGGQYCVYCLHVNPNYNPCAKGHTFMNGYCIYCLERDPSWVPSTPGSDPTTIPTNAPTVPTPTQPTADNNVPVENDSDSTLVIVLIMLCVGIVGVGTLVVVLAVKKKS
jgi:flagellar basal body-associated protein FliL